MTRRLLTTTLLLSLVLAWAPSASGALLKFYNPGPPAPNVMTAAGSDSCGGVDVCDFTLTLAGTPGGTLTATGTGGGNAARVIEDLEPNLGGLGVLNSLTDSSSDNIQSGDVLTLVFQTAVSISQLILYSDHEIADFNITINGTNYAVNDSTLTFDTPLLGTNFVFGYVDRQYYVSAMTLDSPPQNIPEPGTLSLLGLGLGGLRFMARRRSSAAK